MFNAIVLRIDAIFVRRIGPQVSRSSVPAGSETERPAGLQAGCRGRSFVRRARLP